MPGASGRKDWKPYFKPFGPIGILLLQCHEKGTAIDKQFCLHQTRWPHTDLLECPFQDLYPTIARIATQARTLAHTDQRRLTTNLYDIDRVATNSSRKKHPKAELGLLRLVQQGATWDKMHNHKSGNTTTTTCDGCGHINADIVHVIWHCPALEEVGAVILQELLPGI